MTLRDMVDFFEIHQLSPLDSIDGSLSAVEIRIKRRINNAIAIIKELTSTTSSGLDASSLPTGMCILKIESTDGEIQTKKIIKK